ncbi:MAG: tetratricopeptide repeat protein [Phycisphaerae bacterium]|nr:tetratricopeptide repeat protein [Saprospiraceae bacterium]
MHTPLRFCIALGLLLAIAPIVHAKAILQGTVSFLNSKSRPAVGVKISAFGATGVYSDDAGMFRLEFSSKVPGDKVNIIIGSNDKDGVALELVNVEAIAQVRIPSNPEEDIVEIIVCRVGQRNDAALRYNDLIVKTINETMERRLREIDEKLEATKIDAETIVALKKEKGKLAAERDSALAKAEEQALYIASINLDKASLLVRNSVERLQNQNGVDEAIAILDNEILKNAYQAAKDKKIKSQNEINKTIEGFALKIQLLKTKSDHLGLINSCEDLINIFSKEKCCQKFSIYYLYILQGSYRALNKKSLAHFSAKRSFDLIKDIYREESIEYATKCIEYASSFSVNEISLDSVIFYANKGLRLIDKNKGARFLQASAELTLIIGYYNRADNYFENLAFDKAITDFDSILVYCRFGKLGTVNFYNRRGLCYYYLKNYEQAISDYQNAIKYDSTLSKKTYLNNIGICYVKKRDFRHAKETFKALEKVDTQNAYVFRNWAMYHALQNDNAKAIENLQKAVSLGYKDLKWIETDDSLESIRGEQGYKEIVEQLKKGQ